VKRKVIKMDRTGFVNYMMKEKRKPVDTTNSYVKRIRNFEKFLTKSKKWKKP